MSSKSRITLIGAVGVVLFDVAASFVSRWQGFDYGWAVIGSWLMYTGLGFAVVRAERSASGLRAGGVIGLVDATCGWGLSWVIGPGQVDGASPGMVVVTVALVTLSAAILGAVGAFLARWVLSPEHLGADSDAA